MLLNRECVESIKNRQVTFVKSACNISFFEEFDDIFKLNEVYDCPIKIWSWDVSDKSEIFLNKSTAFQMFGVDIYPDIKSLVDLLHILIYEHVKLEKIRTEIFFSLSSGISNAHVDNEDVILISLFGETSYRLFDNQMNYVDYKLNPGDLLYIPNGIRHRADSLGKRAVLGIGFFLTNTY